MALSFTDENFETEVLNSDVPVLVDFWAPWCGPCKAIGPIIDQLAQEYTDVKIGKVNVDNEAMVAQQYNISSIPAILMFKNGEVVDSMIGAQPKSALQNMINRHR